MQTSANAQDDVTRSQCEALFDLLRGPVRRSRFWYYYLLAQIALFFVLPLYMSSNGSALWLRAESLGWLRAVACGVCWTYSIALIVGLLVMKPRPDGLVKLAYFSTFYAVGILTLLTAVVPVTSTLPLLYLLVGTSLLESNPKIDNRRLALILAIVAMLAVLASVLSNLLFSYYGFAHHRQLWGIAAMRTAAIMILLVVLLRIARRETRMVREMNDLLNKLGCGLDIISSDHSVVYANRWQLDRFGIDLGDQPRCFEAIHGRAKPCAFCTTDQALHRGSIERVEYVDGQGPFKVTAVALEQQYDGKRLVLEVVDPLADLRDLLQKAVRRDRAYLTHELRKLWGSDFASMFHEIVASLKLRLGLSDLPMRLIETDDDLHRLSMLRRYAQISLATLQEWQRMTVGPLAVEHIPARKLWEMADAEMQRSVARHRIQLRRIDQDFSVVADPAVVKSAIKAVIGNFNAYVKGQGELSIVCDQEIARLALAQPDDPVPAEDIPILFLADTRGSRKHLAPGQGNNLANIRQDLQDTGASIEYHAQDAAFVIGLPTEGGWTNDAV